MEDNIVVSGGNVRQSKAGGFYSNLFGNRVNVNAVWEIKIDELSVRVCNKNYNIPLQKQFSNNRYMK